MGEGKVCTCASEKNKGHICMLKSKGWTHEIKKLTGNPNVACITCGATANSEDNVCSPVPLFI